MYCSWVYTGSEQTCGEPAEIYSNLPMCETHQVEYSNRVGNTARQAAKQHPLGSFPGLCYFVLLPDGSVKIGYSNTEELLKKRLQSLKRELGPIIKLAAIPGGFVAEAVMHDRFKKYRIPGRGERFTYSAEMAEFLSELDQ